VVPNPSLPKCPSEASQVVYSEATEVFGPANDIPFKAGTTFVLLGIVPFSVEISSMLVNPFCEPLQEVENCCMKCYNIV
jgi:hypothetical protein